MKRIWIHKDNSFEAAHRFENSYYSRMTPSKRLETIQFLREIYFKAHPELYREARKRLRRSIKVIQQK